MAKKRGHTFLSLRFHTGRRGWCVAVVVVERRDLRSSYSSMMRHLGQHGAENTAGNDTDYHTPYNELGLVVRHIVPSSSSFRVSAFVPVTALLSSYPFVACNSLLASTAQLPASDDCIAVSIWHSTKETHNDPTDAGPSSGIYNT